MTRMFWLSFSDPKWAMPQCCITELDSDDLDGISEPEVTILAIRKAHEMACNPGGEVLVLPFPDEVPAEFADLPRHRLLTVDQLRSVGAVRGDIEDETTWRPA